MTVVISFLDFSTSISLSTPSELILPRPDKSLSISKSWPPMDFLESLMSTVETTSYTGFCVFRKR